MTMMGQDFQMLSGNYRLLRCTVVDDNQNPVDLSGFINFRWGAKSNYRLPHPSVEKELGDGIQLEQGEVNVALVELLPADTINLKGTYHHELKGTDLNGNPTTLLTGQMIVHPAILIPVV